MYLARKRIKGRIRFYIRESITNGRKMVSRELYDLGYDPAEFIIYPDNGRAFYFHQRLIERLEEQGVKPDNEALEQLFWPFLDPESRRVIEMFTRPSTSRGMPLSEQKKRCESEPFHSFDKRRMHYLRFGAMDQSGIGRAPKKIYRKLLDKSRDEIEQQFIEMERVLGKTEKKNYVYTIFDVSGHFRSEIARQFPQALDQERVDTAFLEELCRINDDREFWSDLGISDRLDDYLLRYAIWFFDTDFEGSNYLQDLAWQFKRRHHGFTPPPPRVVMPVEEAVAIMGITQQELDGMTIRTLTRQYRLRAQSVHPDKGGSHEQFIRLNRAFSDLLRKVKGEGEKVRYTTRRG